jgi:hypothetical protein
MNANRKMSKAEMLRQPKKQTKSGKRKQKMFLRIALARKLRVPASDLKGKTFEELADLLDKEDLKDVLATLDKANLLLGDDEEEPKKAMEPIKGKLSETTEELKKMMPRREEEDFSYEDEVNRKKEAVRVSSQVQGGGYEYDFEDNLEEISGGMSNLTVLDDESEGKYGRYDTDDEEDEDNLDQAEVWQYPALGVAPNANLEVPNSSLNDNMIVSANARSAFQPNPLVPVRGQFEPIRREVLEDNENMRNDPNPEVIPPQDILEQVRILEGPEGMMPHGEPHRLPNPVVVNDPRLAQNNMGSMEQNVMMNRNMMDRREMRRQMFGEGDEGKYDDAFGAMPEDDDFDELDQNEDIYNEDFEGISNRERIDEMKKIMSYQQAGKWNGNMGVGRDYARSAMIRGAEANITNVNAMRGKPLYPYKIPDRTYAGNSVNMIRNSNRSMLLQTGMLLP